MIVVSNTSPLTNLAAIERFDLLRDLYGEVHSAEGVLDELNAGGRPYPGSREAAGAKWVQRHTVQRRELVTTLLGDLDRGEAETVALALELGADLVLIDERAGRRHAQRHGLQTLGVVGMLIEAKAAELITRVRPEMVALRERAGFYLSNAVFRQGLRLAGEQSN